MESGTAKYNLCINLIYERSFQKLQNTLECRFLFQKDILKTLLVFLFKTGI